MTRICVAWLGASLLLVAAARAQELCDARVQVEPQSAFVGQQLTYRLQILRHADVASVRFARELSFPSFRVEWLPGQTPDPAITDIGDHMLVFEERRALFAVRAGELLIPAARLLCTSTTRSVEIEVPAARVDARELPRDGQPPGFRGVVGRVQLQAHVERERIALGESLRLAISATGPANLWDAAAPFEPERDLPGVDAYPRAPELEVDAGRHLVVRRAFYYQLVPRAVGSFTLPTLRLPYFDATSGRYAVAESEPQRFFVDAATPVPAPSPRPPRARDDGAAGVRILALLGVALFVAMGIGLTAFALALGRARKRGRGPLRAATPFLDAATAARARGDRPETARNLAAALRAALEVRLPGASALTAEELALRDDASLRAIGEALRALDRARFAPAEDAARTPDTAAVQALIRSL